LVETAPGLGQHPPAPGRQRGQIELIGAVSAQELQLGQLRLQNLRSRGGRTATQPRQSSHAQLVVDLK
jgi:hypothetical protein